ncbi:MAG: ATP synthase F1 subunit delta [Rickettsiales bacterium]|jgi:F-type H+-transporting ATPase subunit delta
MKNSGSKKISERYVSAVFDVATQADALVAVEKDLLGLADLIKENADFHDFLYNPLLTRDAQVSIAANLLEKIGTHAVTAKFVALLAHNKRLDILPEMIELFLKELAISRGEIAAELVVARAISTKEADAIAQSLGKAYNKKINLSVRKDAALLGGTIINIGSVQLDGSLAGKLNRLKIALHAA